MEEGKIKGKGGMGEGGRNGRTVVGRMISCYSFGIENFALTKLLLKRRKITKIRFLRDTSYNRFPIKQCQFLISSSTIDNPHSNSILSLKQKIEMQSGDGYELLGSNLYHLYFNWELNMRSRSSGVKLYRKVLKGIGYYIECRERTLVSCGLKASGKDPI